MKEKTNLKRVNVKKMGLAIVLLIFIIFIILTVTKMIIIGDLQNKIGKYTSSNNYYAKVYTYQGEYLNIIQTYKKDNKYLTILKNMGDYEIKKLVNYNDGKTTNTYIDSNNEKIVIINSVGLPSPIIISNLLYTENIFQFVAMSVCSSIETEECNGKECYKINNTMYIEKETGLLIRLNNGTIESNGERIGIISDYQYEFNNVKDEDIKEPADVNEYKLQENI